MPYLLVIGSPSIDKLHFKNLTVNSAGGTGLYTALAARRSGCKVSMYGPRPNPIPELLKPSEKQLEAWLGPIVTLDDIPHFEISHDGDKATYLEFYVGEEGRLDPSALPQDLSIYDGVHITALGTAKQQLRFADVCRERGAKMISSGSFLNLIEENPDMVRTLIEKTDIFFLNEEEAIGIFGSLDKAFTKPGKILFITRGGKGAIVVQGNFRTELPAVPANVLDPTGAGDTFCGATISNLLQGDHPIIAARKAMTLASEEIEHVGPAALLFNQKPPEIPLDERIRVDMNQIDLVSQIIKKIPEAEPFNFVSDYYPPVGHPSVMDYMFVQTLHQFSFWEANHGRYDYPLIATIDGHKCKGSTYLSYAYMRPLDKDPEFFSPKRQAYTTKEETLALFRADDGSDPMPALDLHLSKAQDYGKDMLFMGLTPQAILEESNESSKPLKNFLSIMDHIGGYKEDPLRKKSNLLALILSERPEKFFSISTDEEIPPVVDYHSMRFSLRTGLVDITDIFLRKKIANRELVTIEEEWAIRHACYVAVQRLIDVSGLSEGAVDNVTFSYTRKHCPEMTEPVCEMCAMDPACAHRKELFQPVIRTTFY